MPEMPEVETLARNLRRAVVGKRVEYVRLSGLPLRRPVEEGFPRMLEGRTIARIHRRGKYLVVQLEPRLFWLVHLGMSGSLLLRTADEAEEKHTHAVIRFSDASELRYRDHRRFGLLAAYDVPRIAEIPEIQRLGKDPLNGRLDQPWLWARLRASRQEVKSFLLDQRRLAGIGNIYACEALHRAGIHPARRCHTVTKVESERLLEAVRSVLKSAIRHRGTTFSDFMDSNGSRGSHQEYLRVFQREGESCRRCGDRIRRLRQGNRSSFFCPVCQAKRGGKRRRSR